MIVPRGLWTTKERQPWEIVEEDDPRGGFVLCGAGAEYADADAKALGITDYLKASKAKPDVEAKAVAQAEVEDKAVAGPDEAKADEPKGDAPDGESQPGGVTYPPETRRLRGRP